MLNLQMDSLPNMGLKFNYLLTLLIFHFSFLYFKVWVLPVIDCDKKWNIKKSFLIILQDKKALTLHTKNS